MSYRIYPSNNIQPKKIMTGKTILVADNIEFNFESSLVMKTPYLKIIRSKLNEKEVIITNEIY